MEYYHAFRSGDGGAGTYSQQPLQQLRGPEEAMAGYNSYYNYNNGDINDEPHTYIDSSSGRQCDTRSHPALQPRQTYQTGYQSSQTEGCSNWAERFIPQVNEPNMEAVHSDYTASPHFGGSTEDGKTGIIVRHLSSKASAESIRKMIERVTSNYSSWIDDIHVPVDSTGRTRRHAFITFKCPSVTKAAKRLLERYKWYGRYLVAEYTKQHHLDESGASSMGGVIGGSAIACGSNPKLSKKYGYGERPAS
jgi:hypothetical protein